jgi:predicted anti-sigma-YlaC factor YlaD
VDGSGLPRDGHANAEFSVSSDEVSCREFVELVTDYFEGALATRTLSQVEEHLVMCDWCSTYLDQMQATVTALTALRDEAPPVEQPPELALGALRARRNGQR